METVERKEVNGGKAILPWAVAVERNAWLRFAYSFWAGFGMWALWYLRPDDTGRGYIPGTFGEWAWLLITSVLAGLALAGGLAALTVWATHRNWLRDYWLETFSVTERAADVAPPPRPLRSSESGQTFVPSPDGAVVASGERSYRFSAQQMRLMFDRIDEGNFGVARDAFRIETAAYPEVCHIMIALGYWRRERNTHEWTPEGVEWLKKEARLL